MLIHDFIGIGFGPSNIALAIALEEMQQAGAQNASSLFIERQAGFTWHPNMVLEHAHKSRQSRDIGDFSMPTGAFPA